MESFYAEHGCIELVKVEQSKRSGKGKSDHEPDESHRYCPEVYMADFIKPDKITIWDIMNMCEHERISIASPRDKCVFSNGKAYLFDKSNESRRDVRNLILYWNFGSG